METLLQINKILNSRKGVFISFEGGEGVGKSTYIDFLKKDLNHENIASNFLKDFFSEEITESIRLHVVAKRYLCSIDNSYYESLSKASKNSFKVQGGALNKEEINELENNKYFKDAVRLRKWDDRGKVSLKEVEELDTYKEMIVAERLAIY